jgi:environmental stress-induced protein Ves
MKIVRKSSFVASPWKNGGGITHEALRHPAGGVDFKWRVSMAEIDASGPFSDFSGCRRTMVLLRGAGLRLSHANGEVALLEKPGDLAEFDGAVATRCDLLAGPCVDLNLMTSKSLPAARVAVAPVRNGLTLTKPPHQTMLVFCVAGRLELEGPGGESRVVEEWDLAVIPAGSSETHGQVTIVPEDKVVAGLLPPATPGSPLAFWAFLADT